MLRKRRRAAASAAPGVASETGEANGTRRGAPQEAEAGTTPFTFAGFRAEPASNELRSEQTGDTQRLEPRTMDVLVLLARNAGQVVSRQTFAETVWPGRQVVDDSLSQCISELRKALGDKAREPGYIRTVPKRGYCFLPEAHWPSAEAKAATAVPPKQTRRAARVSVWFGAVALAALISAVFLAPPSGEPTAGGGAPGARQIMSLLAPGAEAADSLRWRSGSSAAEEYLVERTWLDRARARLEILDQTGTVVWGVVRNAQTAEQRHQAATELADTLSMIATQQTGPTLNSFPPTQQRLFKRARYHVDRRTLEDLERARGLIEQVLSQYPESVEAILLLAEVQRGLAGYDRSLEGPIGQRAAYEALIARVEQLAPQHPAVRARNYSPGVGTIDWQQYETVLRELVAEAPDCAACAERLSDFYLQVGWVGRAVAVWEEHTRYWPTSVSAHATLARLYARRGDAEATLRQVKLISALAGSESWDVRVAEINAYVMLGDVRPWLERVRSLLGEMDEAGELRLRVYEAIAADDEPALEQLSQEEQLLRDFNIALSLGRLDALVARIEHNLAYGEYRDLELVHGWRHEANPINRRYLEGLARLRRDDRLLALIERTGLADFWRQRGQLADYCYADLRGSPRPPYCS